MSSRRLRLLQKPVPNPLAFRLLSAFQSMYLATLPNNTGASTPALPFTSRVTKLCLAILEACRTPHVLHLLQKCRTTCPCVPAMVKFERTSHKRSLTTEEPLSWRELSGFNALDQ